MNVSNSAFSVCTHQHPSGQGMLLGIGKPVADAREEIRAIVGSATKARALSCWMMTAVRGNTKQSPAIGPELRNEG